MFNAMQRAVARRETVPTKLVRINKVFDGKAFLTQNVLRNLTKCLKC